MRPPTVTERGWILNQVRKQLDHATGARYCDCTTQADAAHAFRRTRDPDCQICDPYTGLIKLPGWNGSGEHFDYLLTVIKQGQQGGTAMVEPTDGVGPDKTCANYNTSSWGMTLERGWDSVDGGYSDVTGLTWAKIRAALLEAEQSAGQLELAVGV